MAKKRDYKEESNEWTWEIPRRVTSDAMMMPYLRRARRSSSAEIAELALYD